MSNDAKSLSLQKKVSLTLLGVTGLLALVSYAVLDVVVARAFDDLELREAHTNLVRAERAIDAELATLERLSTDWGPWDDTYDFVQGHAPKFEQANLHISTFDDLQLNLMLFYDVEGDLVWERLLLDGEIRNLSLTGVFGDYTVTDRSLQSASGYSEVIGGILQTGVGPMLVIAHPITRTDYAGPVVGTIVFGRLLDDARLAKLRKQTEVAFSWHPLDTAREEFPEPLAGLSDVPTGVATSRTSTKQIEVFTVLEDLHGEPALLLRAQTERAISALGTHAISTALAVIIAVGLAVMAVIGLSLNASIVRPLASLQSRISAIRSSGDLSGKLGMRRSDEIGAVARDFDELTEQLRDAQALVLDQSFKAGKADNAAEVLHNIRNAMTPVINGIDRLAMVCSVTSGLKVAQAVEQLNSNDCDVARRAKLIKYIDSAFRHVEEAHAEGDRELKAVSRQARQVEAILADQEKHAKAGPSVEDLALGEMVEEAVLVLPKRRTPKIDLAIRDDIGRFKVRGHRVGLLQVLGNLVLNAYEAIQRNNEDTGEIELYASSEMVSGEEMVRVTVRDRGCGFGEERKAKIFQRGFSSKNGNLSGLGLHWCANAVAGMGGRISAESKGDGSGAAFHVLLPAASGA